MSLENGKKIYDLVVLGEPAGITAAIYGGRAGLDVLMWSRCCGGITIFINYPGFPEGLGGLNLGKVGTRAGALGRKLSVLMKHHYDKTPKGSNLSR